MDSQKLKLAGGLAGAAALAALILYTGGFFAAGQIEPGREAGGNLAPSDELAQAKSVVAVWPQFFEAVGTVRPRTETKVEAQVRGRVLQVKVRPGQIVKAGQPLVVLADKEYKARLGQASQSLSAARAALDLANSEYSRLSRLLKSGSAPKRDVDRALENRQRTQAMLRRAQQQVEEARVSMGYTRVNAPEAGQVVQRLIEPGDMALPGRPLIMLETGGALRLEALVSEGLITKVRLGQELDLMVPSLGHEVKGQVEEIVPSADPQTRTFVVKVVLPNIEGLYSGMFGRLMIPVGEEKVVLAPEEAIKRIGQLETVLIKDGDTLRRVYVTTGRGRDKQVEVLSGLNGGETLAIPRAVKPKANGGGNG